MRLGGEETDPLARNHPETVPLANGETLLVIYPDGTPNVLDVMLSNPEAVLWCRHGDGPALVVVEVPKGCVCFPDDTVQGLCAQHHDGADSFPITTLIDLSVNNQWTQHIGDVPVFDEADLTPEVVAEYKADLIQRVTAAADS